jgi:aromatic-L-amino-acid decarboxylase
MATWVDADDRFERVAPVNFSVVCFRLKGSDEQNQAIVERVNGSGEFFISPTVLNGKLTLRAAIGNRATKLAHVKRLWELICTPR